MKILVVTGSSGGHIYPALAFLDSLPAGDTESILVLPKKSIRISRDKYSYKIKYLSIVPIKNITALFKFVISSFESLGILLSFKPEVVVSFGSLSGVAMIIFARMLRIKTLLQEQNVIPGRANRFLAKFADKICVGFRESAVYFKGYPKKLVFTGNPIRNELKILDKIQALEHFGFHEGRVTILVVGGSQGSRRINSEFIRVASLASWKGRVQVIHISGQSDFGSVSDKYSVLEISNRVFAFLNDMQYAYSAADLVICRAGAITIAELMHFKIPALIIPYPFAYQHQKANASILERNNCVLVIDDKDLDKENILEKALADLLNSGDNLIRMRSGYNNFVIPDSNALLKQAALN
ncbi:MAG: UDP-N-acetylglucosamine--N-acetylmuramyl-(pentapeptide) pyrophosphoryl-undecaprenol N-acetylglucosamine transferase [Candidatus Omnitrophota bacterium]|nr:UDP-N-acetylglucosamine--N-acetylmuramyl-(pentapeptide) pyrophosphoryl-undecaprenol N-acetylglucosamine transferase [Candidatus Omnitrophota bacterium]